MQAGTYFPEMPDDRLRERHRELSQTDGRESQLGRRRCGGEAAVNVDGATDTCNKNLP